MIRGDRDETAMIIAFHAYIFEYIGNMEKKNVHTTVILYKTPGVFWTMTLNGIISLTW